MHVILQPNSVLYNWFCLIFFVLPADEKHLGALESDHLLISLCMGRLFSLPWPLKCVFAAWDDWSPPPFPPVKISLSQKRKEPHRSVTNLYRNKWHELRASKAESWSEASWVRSHIHVVMRRHTDIHAPWWSRKFIFPKNVRHIVLIIHRTMKIHCPEGAQCPLVFNKLVSIKNWM